MTFLPSLAKDFSVFKRFFLLLVILNFVSLDTQLRAHESLDEYTQDQNLELNNLLHDILNAQGGDGDESNPALVDDQAQGESAGEISQDKLKAEVAALTQRPQFRRLIAQMREKELRQRNAYESLPQVMQVELSTFMDRYTDFINSVHIPDVVYKIGVKVFFSLEKQTSEESVLLRSLLNEALAALKKGQWGALFNSASLKVKNDTCEMLGDIFGGVLTHNIAPLQQAAGLPQLMGGVPSQAGNVIQDAYKVEDLAQLAAALKAISADTVNIPELEQFKEYIDALLEEDMHKLASLSFLVLATPINELANNLFIIQTKLAQAYFEQQATQADKDQSAAVSLPEDKTEALSLINELIVELEQAAQEIELIESYEDEHLNHTLSKEMQENKGRALAIKNNPYLFWLEQLRTQERSIDAYKMIEMRFHADDAPSKEIFNFFKVVGHAYSFAKEFLAIYYGEAKNAYAGAKKTYYNYSYYREMALGKNPEEAKQNLQKELNNAQISLFDYRMITPWFVDCAFTGAFAANYFFKMQAVAQNANAYGTLLQKGSLQDMGVHARVAIGDYIGIAAAGAIFMGDPVGAQRPIASGMRLVNNVRNMPDLFKLVSHFGISWAYYHIFYNGLFNRNATLKGFVNNQNQFIPGSPDAGTANLWPAEYPVFNKAMLSTVDYGFKIISTIAIGAVYKNIDPAFIKGCDTATLGLINPGAIYHVLHAFQPIMLLSQMGSVLRGSMSRNDWQNLIIKHYNFFLTDEHGDFLTKDEHGLPTQNFISEKDGMSYASIYLERSLFIYGCSMLGYNAGAFIGDSFYNEILAGTKGTLKGLGWCCDKIGLGKGDSASLIDKVYSSVDNTVVIAMEGLAQLLHLVLWPSPEIEPIIESSLRAMLLENRLLAPNHSKQEYREAIVTMILMNLMISGFVNYADAAGYIQQFRAMPTRKTLESICEGVLDNVKHKLLSMGTGSLTQFFTYRLAQAVYDKPTLFGVKNNLQGPLTPKIMRGFGFNRANAQPAVPQPA